jgi:6-phosphogluconolactonase (cycloisomerase 2 family)
MSKRWGWLLGTGTLIAIGLTLACGTSYNTANDGFIVMSSQGSGLLESFAFDLNSGTSSAVYNPPGDTANVTCQIEGNPYQVVINPAGTYAYAILIANPTVCTNSQTGIATFKIESDGEMKQVGSLIPDPNPTFMAMDSKGQYLYVAEGLNTVGNNPVLTGPSNYTCPGTTSQFAICSYSIGSNGTLTPLPAVFVMPQTPQVPNFVSLAVTPTVFPGLLNGVQVALCSNPGISPPTNEFLYAVDSVNYEVWAFSINPATGVLGGAGAGNVVIGYPTGTVPMGVAVDACDRFVYVSNYYDNTVSAFTLCANIVNNTCPLPNGTLNTVAGSPFNLSGGANGPEQVLVDPFGNSVYVLDTLSNQVSSLKISPLTGALTQGATPIVTTGAFPTSMAIRSDDSWLFVADFYQQELSEYSIVPQTGALFGLATIATDNNPWGVAVK